MTSYNDARAVLDAYRSGSATIIGKPTRFPIVRFDGVTGSFKNQLPYETIDEPSNVFMIKGTASPSIVPVNPQGV